MRARPESIDSEPGPQALPARGISVIIASWNARDRLLACVRSIAGERVSGGIEVIVVDNASTDGSADAVRREFPAALLTANAANLGFARATNLGMRRASGRYLFLVNSDVVVRPGAIGALTRFMDARPRVGLAGPRVLNGDGTLQHSCRRFPAIRASTNSAFAMHRLFPRSPRFGGEVMLYWDHDRERSVDAVSGCFCVVRAEALSEVGELDERFFLYAEDVDWCMRFRAAGWDVRFCPEAEVVHYRGASSSNDRGRFAGEMVASLSKLYRKHYSRPVAAVLLLELAVFHLLRLAARLVLYGVRPSRRASLRMKIDEHLGAVKGLLRATS